MSFLSMVFFSPRFLARSVGAGLALIVTAFLVSPAGHAESQPGWLGVYIERSRADVNVPGRTDHGVMVSAVVADGPAAKAGRAPPSVARTSHQWSSTGDWREARVRLK